MITAQMREFKKIEKILHAAYMRKNVKTLHIKRDNSVFIIEKNGKKWVLKVGDISLADERDINFEIYKNIPKNFRKHIVKPLELPSYYSAKFPYLTFHLMELVKGQPLGDLLQTGKLSTKDINNIKLQLRTIFNEIWKLGYLHGDLHTLNIMITPDMTVKIIDFGFTQKVNPYTENKNVFEWFKTQWPYVLQRKGIPKGNPNIWVMGSLANVPMYSLYTHDELKKYKFI